MKQYLLRNIILGSALILSLFAVVPSAEAAPLTARSDSILNSAGGANTAHTFRFTTATAASIGSIDFQYCTTATGACTTPAGVDTSAATLTQQNGATGFSIVTTANGDPYITRTAGPVGSGVALLYTLSNVVNPSANNTAYYVKITTYTGTDGATGPTDSGVVAVGTTQPLSFTGITPESLVFCVGTSITSDCTTISGSLIDFGVFSPLSTSTGNSVMQASTNAANGYAITVNGQTLSSGANTIPGMSLQAGSSTGSSQFGLNVRANTSPINFGADVAGPGTASYSSGYDTANLYKFVSGDTVAQAAGPSDVNTFTSSYIVNIKGSQAAGVYTTTLTYTCTASF